MADDDRKSTSDQPKSEAFRWQALFQRAAEPFFLLDRRRRFLFVNHAWERLTGVTAAEARGLKCRRRAVSASDPWDLVLRTLCCPPPEVHHGRPARVRRLVPGRSWWDLDFLPLADDDGLLCVLGRIIPRPEEAARPQGPAIPLAERLSALHQAVSARLDDEHRAHLWRPENLVALRERMLRRHSLDQLKSTLPALGRVAEQVRLAAQTHVAVLIAGEPGTGKQWLARTIHAQSAREVPFVALDCGHLPMRLAGEVLDGPARQAGTLYVREPARLAHDLQRRLLDLLHDDGPARPRVLAGCTADPAEEVAAGRLLEELHAALATLVIALPPLRERRADLPWLVEQFLERAAGEDDRTVTGLTEAAWEVVRAYRWPANLRELYAVVASARRHTTGERIDAGDLPAPLRLAVGLDQTPGPAAERPVHLDRLLEEAERRLIQLALRRTHGHKTKAAELLSIWRQRLVRRMEALGIADTGTE